MTPTLMACGCRAQGVFGTDDQPICVVHLCRDVAVGEPDLTGRTAFCTYGKHAEQPSSLALAFFRHVPDQPNDRYYCGCYGWD